MRINNDNKNKLIVVIRAIQKARGRNPYVKLFITRQNGLLDMDYDEIVEIIESLDKKNLIEVNHLPDKNALLINNKPHSDIFPMNYLSLIINNKFDSWVNNFGSPIFLLSLIPLGKKYRTLRKIAEFLVSSIEIDNFIMAQSFIRPLDTNTLKKRKLKKDEYISERKKINYQIKNRLKTLRRIFKPHGYIIIFRQGTTKLVKSS